MLSRFVIAFLPRSKCLLISWLQSPSTVILESKKINEILVSINQVYWHIPTSIHLCIFMATCLKKMAPMDRGAWRATVGSQRVRHDWSDLAQSTWLHATKVNWVVVTETSSPQNQKYSLYNPLLDKKKANILWVLTMLQILCGTFLLAFVHLICKLRLFLTLWVKNLRHRKSYLSSMEWK